MLEPVEVLHGGRWLPATMLATRLEADGWHGLVGYTDPITRQGFYRWFPKSMLRAVPDAPAAAAADDDSRPGAALTDATGEPPSG